MNAEEIARELIRIANRWLEEIYPEEFFPPLSGKDNDELNDMLKHNGWSRDQISGDMMRRAANLLKWEAEKLDRGEADNV